MKLLQQRSRTPHDTTVSNLSIVEADGSLTHECFILEDVVREVPGLPVLDWKVPGKTAIPQGTYEIVLENSPKFGKDTMTLKEVESFSYIRIHGGFDEDSTEGCLVTGTAVKERGKYVIGSQAALARLKKKVKAAITAKEKVIIEIRNPDLEVVTVEAGDVGTINFEGNI